MGRDGGFVDVATVEDTALPEIAVLEIGVLDTALVVAVPETAVLDLVELGLATDEAALLEIAMIGGG